MSGHRRSTGATTRRIAHFFLAAATACGLVSLAPALASAATQTQLSETGWTASSNTNSSAGDAPQNAISGDTGARFSSDADQAAGMWWQVNLGSAQSFDQIEMDSGGYAGDYAHGYQVEVSSDGTNFTAVYTGTGTANPITATFAAQTAKYIRVQLTTAVSTNWWSMVNFTAYTNGSSGSGGGGTTSGQLAETGWAATSNTNSPAGDAPQHAVSGNTGARFSSDAYQAPGMWWQVDMSSVQTFNQVELDSGANTGDYARGYDIEVSNDGTKFTPVYFGTGTSSPETATFSPQQARYIRVLLTASNAASWWSLTNVTVYNSSASTTLPSAPATGGSLGSNVYVFTPSQSVASILSTVNSISNAQVGNQFGSQRYELLFEPGTYGSASNPLVFTVGYYESVAGLGQNPGQVVINGAINSYNQCDGGNQSACYATDNFWRSVSNLTINVTGMTGCFNGTDVWAVSQAAPMRRVNVNGNLTLMDYCDGSPDWASGGFIADSKLNNTVTNGSQQQFFVRNTDLGSWSNGVWNQVFCGDPGAPAQSFSSTSGLSGGSAPYTTLGTCPTTQEEPYLYTDSSGNYNVFVPSAQSNSNGPTWANGNTPGTSLSLNTFYVVNASSTVGQINAALAAGDNLLFTPGVYQYAQTIQVTHANTKILGLGFATLIPTAGNVTLSTADVPGVNVSGLIFDAGPTQSAALLQLGTEGSAANNASDPDSVDDVFFRVGGEEAGSTATAFVDNSDDSLIDDVWSWRADHGAGAGTWTGDQSATGLVVNGDRVTANGLAVEHYEQYETIWNGQGGKVVFFQNENPYEVPSQAAWMSSATQNGYPAFYVPNSVTTFTGYGMGSYSYFSQGVAIENAMAFQAPQTSGISFNDIMTVFLNGSGGIQSVIDGTGTAVSSSFGGPSDIVSFS
ncbi:MAG TPA: discoidin domain-containing protein [Actinospica sp.]|jgi:hypothetical protein|nr:discoidin domain-containing protein [Actinospica sp.]